MQLELFFMGLIAGKANFKSIIASFYVRKVK